MKIAILTIGIPGSGKTSLVKPLAQHHGLTYINRDDIREELLGDASNRSANEKIWEEANKRTEQAIAQGTSVLLDGTFVEKQKRIEIITFLKSIGTERIIGFFVSVPRDTAKERNRLRDRKVEEAVIDRMYEYLTAEPPTLEEGFNALYTTNQFDHLERELVTTQI